eukprot:1804258-Prymnesium_polylepis.3
MKTKITRPGRRRPERRPSGRRRAERFFSGVRRLARPRSLAVSESDGRRSAALSLRRDREGRARFTDFCAIHNQLYSY